MGLIARALLEIMRARGRATRQGRTLPIAPILCLLLFAGHALAQVDQPQDLENVKLFRTQSELLSSFWGRDMFIEAGVVLPPEHDPDERLPVCYSIPGFGGNHRGAWRTGPALVERIRAGESPRMIYVFLNAQLPLGHHEFADSVNNGPWGEALRTEFIPALERRFGAYGAPEARFLTGHSSGGWSSLWLQVAYPEFFGGVWSTAPDSVDFRDFIGINIYEWENAYVDPNGEEMQLVRRGGEWRTSLRDFTARELTRNDYGGQMASFDAVFSPRGPDGRPMAMYDRETGEIDSSVAEAWKKYDISLILRENWPTLGPKLRGKLRVYCGTLDTYRLEGAVRLLKTDMQELGSDALIVLVEGRNHGSIRSPYEPLWPDGLIPMIHREMRREFDARLSR